MSYNHPGILLSANSLRFRYVSEDILIIKKYSNRRLYDTQTSQYITLEDLYVMVKNGVMFKVIDAKTEDDLTRSVLAQIILEQEGKGFNLLPESFLRNIIRFYGDNYAQIVPHYLDAMMDTFIKEQEKFKSQFTDPMAAFEQITKQNMELFQNTLKLFDPFGLNKKK